MRFMSRMLLACVWLGASVPDVRADDWLDAAGRRERRFYLSGIVGDAFTTVSSGGFNTAGGSPVANTGAAANDLLAIGGAVGMSAARSDGEVRFELEALGRGALDGVTDSVFPPQEYAVRVDDSWTVMANLWRDYSFSDRLGVYGGGGIGAGGYRIAVNDLTVSGNDIAAAFAWQVGTGITWRIGPRATLDFGYRFIDLGTVSTPLALGDGSPAGNYTSDLSASQWMLSVRIYEPFAGLRR